jgi:hypothetical protein
MRFADITRPYAGCQAEFTVIGQRSDVIVAAGFSTYQFHGIGL